MYARKDTSTPWSPATETGAASGTYDDLLLFMVMRINGNGQNSNGLGLGWGAISMDGGTNESIGTCQMVLIGYQQISGD